MLGVLAALIAASIVFVFIVVGVLVLTWILATLLPLFGVTGTVTWLHGLAIFLLIGFFTRVNVRKE